MARYIDADNLKQVLTELYDLAKWDYRELHFSLFDMIGNIDGETTEDVKPVVHAYWLESYWGGTGAECSNCNYLIHACDIDYQEVKHDFEYCPYCGAKMDGDVDGKIC